MAEDNKLFDLDIIAPDRMFYQGKVYFLEMKTSEGEIGVFRGHVPTTAVLVPGLVKIYQAEGEEPKEGVIHGGFVEILQSTLTGLKRQELELRDESIQKVKVLIWTVRRHLLEERLPELKL